MQHNNHSVVQKKKSAPVRAAAGNAGKYGTLISDNRKAAALQLMSEVPVNDNKGLEKEADLMGAKALQRVAVSGNTQPTQNEFPGIPNPPLHYDVTHQLKAINRADLYPIQFSRTKKLWAKLKGGFGKGLDSLGWILGGGVGGYLGALASASIGLPSAGQLNDVPTVVGGMIGSYLGESLQKTYQTPYEEPHDIENPIINENSALLNN
ncbi:MAG: hypothetical protein NTW29_16850 [Bacteroidetes bacterium]|nr:hypothetical protein [Bacteroidota bacterium]